MLNPVEPLLRGTSAPRLLGRAGRAPRRPHLTGHRVAGHQAAGPASSSSIPLSASSSPHLLPSPRLSLETPTEGRKSRRLGWALCTHIASLHLPPRGEPAAPHHPVPERLPQAVPRWPLAGRAGLGLGGPSAPPQPLLPTGAGKGVERGCQAAVQSSLLAASSANESQMDLRRGCSVSHL